MNLEFSFSQTSCFTKAEEPSLPYYLPIAGGRIIGFIPFPRVLVLCEMQSVSSRIWTRVAVFTSYDDTHYTTGTSTPGPSEPGCDGNGGVLYYISQSSNITGASPLDCHIKDICWSWCILQPQPTGLLVVGDKARLY